MVPVYLIIDYIISIPDYLLDYYILLFDYRLSMIKSWYLYT